MENHTIYTLGYASDYRDPHTAKGELDAWMVLREGIVIDIRLDPVSQLDAWCQINLQARYGEKYLHLVELGNRNHHLRGAPIDLVDEAAGLQQAEFWLEHYPICLICGCRSPWYCHRGYVANVLSQRTGAGITHLLYDPVAPSVSSSRYHDAQPERIDPVERARNTRSEKKQRAARAAGQLSFFDME